MALLPTGSVTFNWPATAGADGYYVKVHKNGVNLNTFNVDTNSLVVTGLKEGDSVRGNAFSYQGNNTSTTSVSLSEQSIPVFNFHVSGKTFDFNSIAVNGQDLNFTNTANGYYASAEYENNQSLINFSVINPRDDSTLFRFGEEPFFSGAQYIALDKSQGNGYVGEIRRVISPWVNDNNTGVVGELLEVNVISPSNGKRFYRSDGSFIWSNHNQYLKKTVSIADRQIDAFDLSSFTFGITNTYDKRNFTAQIIVNDYYGSGITGNIDLSNEPISINSVILQNSYINNTTAQINVIPSYSNLATGVEFILYDDDTFSTYHSSGITDSVSNFSTTISFDSTGFLHLRPYDWFGSGHLLERNQLIYLSSEEFIPKNEIKNFRIADDELANTFSIYSEYEDKTTSGSFFTLSIDADPVNSFNSDSYFTGVIEDLSTGHYFNHFNYRTGTHENFYFNINLFQSGSNSFEDDSQQSAFAANPRFLNSGINFDYINGITTLSFDTDPPYSFTGVDILLSGEGTSSFDLYSGNRYQSGDISVMASAKLVRSDDYSSIFDQVNFSGSGQNQSLGVNPLGGVFNAADGLLYFDVFNKDPLVLINSVNAYRKLSFLETESSVGSALSGILDFNDYDNHFHELAFIGNYPSFAPSGMSRNNIYDSTGIGFTGQYQSGRHFVYRFEPVNGYGTGQATDPIQIQYTLNAISEGTENSLIDLENTVDGISSVGSSISYYIRTTGIASGAAHINVDWSSEFSPSTPPIISSNIISYNPDDHIIGSQISGFPTTGGATFIFTDDIPSTGYFLNITAIEPL